MPKFGSDAQKSSRNGLPLPPFCRADRDLSPSPLEQRSSLPTLFVVRNFFPAEKR
jgi:hypothetical protein